jgi:hypothetical protein
MKLKRGIKKNFIACVFGAGKVGLS